MKRSISCIALALALAMAPMVSAPALAGAKIDFAIYRGPAGTGMPTLALLDLQGMPPIISSNHCLAQAMMRNQGINL